MLEGAQRGPLPGLVAVEGEDDLADELVGVHQQPAKHRDVLAPERGTAGGHRRTHAGLVAGHHVGVALDHDRLAAPGDVPLGQVDPVQELALLVERRLRGVQVLGLDRVVVEQPAGAEADHVGGQGPDRPQQPPVEPVDQASPG